MPTVTILDDYQNVALTSADWSPVRAHYNIETINEHITGEAELSQLLGPKGPSLRIVMARGDEHEITPCLAG
jgi:hypothetical protein